MHAPSATPEWFSTKFDLPRLTLKRYAFWTWSLRPAQCTLGASVVSLRRACAAWGEVSAEENAELATVIAEVEGGLRRCFDYDRVNHLMLMMVDSHVHFHVVPRYEAPRERHGLTWTDATWPRLPDIYNGPSDAALLERIRQELLAG